MALAVQKYGKKVTDLTQWMEENTPEGLRLFSFSEKYRRRLRTIDGLERLNRENRRRTRVVVLFPNSASGLLLVTAIIMELIEESRTGRF